MRYARGIIFPIIIFSYLCGLQIAEAASFTFVSDTVSDSRLGASADHTIRFTLTNPLPSSGKLIIIPDSAGVIFPRGLAVEDFDLIRDGTDIELGESAGTGAGSRFGLSIATSTSENRITITLNDADVLQASSSLVVRAGSNAKTGGIGLLRLKNATTTGSYRIRIKTEDASGSLIDEAAAMVALSPGVRVGGVVRPIATTAVLFNSASATSSSLINPDGTKITVDTPASFTGTTRNLRLEISSFRVDDFIPASSPPTGTVADGAIYEVSLFIVETDELVRNFDKEITLNFFYADAGIEGLEESTLKPYRWGGSQWARIENSELFPDINLVRVPISRLSNFMLAGEPRAAAVAPPAAAAAGNGTPSSVSPYGPVVSEPTAAPVVPKEGVAIISEEAAVAVPEGPLPQEFPSVGGGFVVPSREEVEEIVPKETVPVKAVTAPLVKVARPRGFGTSAGLSLAVLFAAVFFYRRYLLKNK